MERTCEMEFMGWEDLLEPSGINIRNKCYSMYNELVVVDLKWALQLHVFISAMSDGSSVSQQ